MIMLKIHVIGERFVTLLLLLGVVTLCRAELHAQVGRVAYVPTDAEILNPERGFYRYSILTNPWQYPQIRDKGQTLVYGRVDASAFRDAPLSAEFLSQIEAGFTAARDNGLKVKFRLAYNDGFEPDAPKEIVLQHIQQLSPLWHDNKDVLFGLDAGFIGAWGEWHASTNGLDTKANRNEILHAILDAVPLDRTVALRYPSDKREIFSGSKFSDEVVITADTAFDGSDLSRVGHLNDCFLSSDTDVGTYFSNIGSWPLSRELEYVGGESRYTMHGGETCALHARSESNAAIAEMEVLHTDYLNLDYHPDVIERWRTEGSFDEIQRRLGYRFQLNSAVLPAAVRPQGALALDFTVENVGFGELFNPRDVEVTLTNNETRETFATALSLDPRFWAGGETHTVATELAIPADVPEGTYTLGLRMPDKDASLRDDVRYSIRFANEGVWDGENGINRLTDSLVVDSSAPGRLFLDVDTFQETSDALSLLGDFNSDSLIDASDLDALSSVLNSADRPLEFDLNGDQQVNFGDYSWWVAEVAQTFLGDANLDGEFNSGDVVDVFQFGLFESGQTAGWQQGDWNADLVFDTGDFVIAFQGGGFETGPRVASVPEPAGGVCTALALGCLSAFMRRR